MSRRTQLLSALLSLAMLTIPAASARAGGQPRTHDRFFLRLAAGPGWASNTLDVGGDKATFSGIAGDLDIAVGAMVRPNFALHGTMFGWAAMNPDLEITIAGVGSGSGTADGYATVSAFGGGATYYFMPTNTYLSGSLGYGSFRFDPDGGEAAETDNGFAFELTAGKEWWVANSWGLGVAAAYIYTSLPEQGISENWSGNAFHVRFSATFN
jgi:hypothetical protein